MFIEELQDPKRAAEFCSFAEPHSPMEEACYSNIMSHMTVHLIVLHLTDGVDRMKAYCMGLSRKDLQEFCFGYAAYRLIQIDPLYTPQAVETCEAAKSVNLETECYEKLVVHAAISFHSGSSERRVYCEQLPVALQEQCLAFY